MTRDEQPREAAPRPRQPGAWRGRVWVAEDFDETPRDVIDAFHESPAEDADASHDRPPTPPAEA